MIRFLPAEEEEFALSWMKGRIARECIMNWLVLFLIPASALAAPPDESSVPNRPLSVRSHQQPISELPSGDSRPAIRNESRVDADVVHAIDDRPAVKQDADTEVIQASEEKESQDRKPITISPSTFKRESLTKRVKSSESSSEPPLPPNKSLAWWVTTGIGLAVVLVAIFVGGRVARRIVPGAVVGDTNGPIQLLHRTFLTPKHTVCLVRCGDRLLLIGLSGDRIQNLSEIHDPQEIDFIRGQLMQIRPKSTTQAFRDMLSGRSQLEEALNPRNEETDEIAPGPAFATKQSGEVPPESIAASPAPKRLDFLDHLSALRSQISQWKSKAGAT